MFNKFKIKWLQNKILKKGDYKTQIEKAIEELNELAQELRLFLFLHHDHKIENIDLILTWGNMQKEIEDASNMINQLKKMFIQSSDQRKMASICRQRIVKQMKDYLRGMK